MNGPAPWLLGLDVLRQIKRDQLGFYARMQARFGDAVPLRLGPYRSLLLFHPDQIEAVLATHGREFIRFEKLMNVLRLWNGESLLIAEGQSWHDRRRKVLPAFRRKALPRHEAVFAQVAQDWSDRLRARADADGRVHLDADETFAQISLDIALRTLFGRTAEDQAEAVSGHIQTLSEVAFRESTSPFSLPDALPLRGKRDKRAAMGFMRGFVRSLVQHRLANPSNEDVLGVLVETHAGKIDDICDDAMSLLIAGHETSGAALSWLFACLAAHPNVLTRARDEITSSGANGPYLQAAISESLRLFPPGYALFLRRATRDVDAAGVCIRRGELAQIIPYTTGRDPRFFESPDEFTPDRFLSAPTWPKYANIPFGAGPRFCIGESFARREIAIIASILLTQFAPRLAGSFPTPLPRFSLRPAGGLPMVWTRL
jgi:cytochrome P450